MNYMEIVLIALALAVDATVYAFSYGLVLRRDRRRAAVWLALVVGVFQAVMPLPGYAGGEVLRAAVTSWSGWVVLGIFAALGVSVIYKAWLGDEEGAPSAPLGVAGLLLVGVATSIDALAVGACMALGDIGGPELELGGAVGIIGAVTFICALGAFHLAQLWHHLPTRWLETLAGVLLISLGLQQVM